MRVGRLQLKLIVQVKAIESKQKRTHQALPIISVIEIYKDLCSWVSASQSKKRSASDTVNNPSGNFKSTSLVIFV